MSVFFRGGVERRDAFAYPAIPPNSMTGSSTVRRVDLSRADAAMQKVAVFASVNLLATLASELPFDVYRGSGQERLEIATPRWLLDLAGDGHGTADFIWQLVFCWGLRGNNVGRILSRDTNTAQPRQIQLQHPDDVQPRWNPDSQIVDWYANGKLLTSDQVWHQRMYPVPGRTLGLSPIALHATTVGLGLSAQNFGAQWFLDGAHPSAILTNGDAKTMTQDAARTVKDRFIAAVRGTREPVVLGGGWEYQQIQIAPGESQFLETQKYTAAECARIFGPGMPEILGYETGGSMTYANIEQRSIDLLTYTIDPWLVRVERVLTALLEPGTYVKFNRKALLRTDTLTRFQAHQIALAGNFETVNEVRSVEDLAPVEWGDDQPNPTRNDSAARLIQQLYLGVGKVVTLDEARQILIDAGVALDDTAKAEDVFADLPPSPLAKDAS